MKRICCLLLCICLFVPFVGCEIKGAEKAFYDIPFESETTALVMLADSAQNAQNEYRFFTSAEDFQKGLAALAQTFDLSAVAEGETKSFETLAEKYTEAFFKDKVLLFVKRYHATEAVLELQSMDAVNNAFQIHAQLASGAPVASVYRVYLLAFDKQYYLSADSTVDVDTQSVEPQTEPYENHLTVAVGNRYKVIADDEAADALIAQIRGMELTPSDYNPDDHSHTAGDIAVVGRGCYAVFTDDYIAVGLSVYAPNSTAKQTVADAYQTLPGTILTMETVTEAEEDA